MTIEEAIQAANNGDIDAMMTLAYHFIQNKDDENAMFWSDRAADAGDFDGAYLSMLCHSQEATVCELIGNWQDSSGNWTVVYKRAYEVLQSQETDEKHIKAKKGAIMSAGDALYGLGLSQYRQRRHEDAIDFLNMAYKDDPKARVLLGVCLNYVGGRTADQQKLYLGYQMLSLLETAYPEMDEDILCVGVLQQALVYRSGMLMNISQDVERAYNLLNRACAQFEDKISREKIQKELSHYRKKRLGNGYVYVE